uniref:p53 and DNA damage-regulated protein 1 n=1 Tax=Arion vulgaris TaxID=1028688 RepID=A0A0B6Y0Y3_9EUPU
MTTESSDETSRLLEYLTDIECVAEDILSSHREIIALDRQRNKTREAIRALQTVKDGQKTWMCAGKMFLKIEKKKAINILNKDFEELDKEIGTSRKNLRPKVNKLRDLEKKDELKGFDLCPLTPEERKSVEGLL